VRCLSYARIRWGIAVLSDEDIAEARIAFFSDLLDRPDVTWFVDANVIIGGGAAKALTDRNRVVTTPEIVEEVRKRPECVPANRFIDGLVLNRSVVAKDAFAEWPGSIDLILGCATVLCPAIRYSQQQLIEDEGMGEEESEDRAIDRAAKDGDFFTSSMFDDMVKAGLLPEGQGAIDRSSRRSFFRYPRKRRERAAAYRYSDESLLATAVANSLLKGDATCVLSDDADCVAIMKQMIDNLLWSMTFVVCKFRGEKLEFPAYLRRWEQVCDEYESYQKRVCGRRGLQSLDALEGGAPYSFEFEPNELVVCRLRDGRSAHYIFTDGMAEYIRRIKDVRTRLEQT
jgi:hypothetical protein